MKILLLTFILLFSPFVRAQDSSAVEIYSSSLGVGEVLRLGEKTIKFKELISDSRCPQDVTCIWPGEAKLLFEVFENGKLSGEEIVVISGGGTAKRFLNEFFPEGFYSFTAYNLEPYPKTTRKIKPSAYRLELEVREKEK